MKKWLILSVSLLLISSYTVKAAEALDIDSTEFESEPEYIPLHEISDSITWNDVTFNAITPVTAFDVDGSKLFVYPYNDSDLYVSIRKIYISKNKYWKTVCAQYKDTDNYKKGDGYELITTSSGDTVSILAIDSESAYVVESKLPSAYVEVCVRQLCQ